MNKRQQNKDLPRGPLEEIGAAKQRRLIVKPLAEALAHVLNAGVVTVVATVPESVTGVGVNFATYSFVVFGPGSNGYPAEASEELLRSHLKESDDQLLKQKVDLEEQILMARRNRQLLAELDQAEAEQRVLPEEYAVEEHHDTSERFVPEGAAALPFATP